MNISIAEHIKIQAEEHGQDLRQLCMEKFRMYTRKSPTEEYFTFSDGSHLLITKEIVR